MATANGGRDDGASSVKGGRRAESATRCRVPRVRRPWYAREDAILRRLYPDTPTEDIATRLGRPLRSVYGHAYYLGLRKSDAFMRTHYSGRLTGTVGARSRFPRGHVPWNKGTHWKAGGRSVATRFKPGQWPANKDPGFYVLGALRWNSDGYLEMRTSFRDGSAGWTGMHIILWEDAHGPVPRGHAVIFRDGDKTNVDLANLECLSRAELMRRNTIHRLPPELKHTIVVLGALKRQIRRRADRETAK